jgi:Zn-dependent protease with chaperone function
VSTVAALVQELAPLLHRPSGNGAAPDAVAALARALPGWDEVRVEVAPDLDICLATGGWPGRPSLTVSRGALEALSEDELAVAVAHEHAHWRRGRWWTSHALFALRLVQPFNPVALWSFREYMVETEIACDRDAVMAGAAGAGDPRPLARALLKVYETTHSRETSARGVLRRRVDALLGTLPVADDRPPVAAVVAAALLLALVLPWLV